MNEEAIIPMLLKVKIVKIKIIKAPKILAEEKSTPKKCPKNKYITTEIEANIKFHKELDIIITHSLVGVVSMASKVPIICSLRILVAKLCSEAVKYPEKAIPIKTNGKYSPPYSFKCADGLCPISLDIK
jgi:hypothetical protein